MIADIKFMNNAIPVNHSNYYTQLKIVCRQSKLSKEVSKKKLKENDTMTAIEAGTGSTNDSS